MLKKLQSFILTSLLGGVIVILPIAILAGVFSWIFNFVTGIIQPFTKMIVAAAEIRVLVAQIIVMAIILATCFFVGVLVATRFGKFLYSILENKLLKIAPGYNLIKETVLQILNSKKAPFLYVVLANIFGNDTQVTGFVTEESANGIYTVFVPTGPNPTSGNMYHLKEKYVRIIDVSLEDAMRTIIGCGAGSSRLIENKR